MIIDPRGLKWSIPPKSSLQWVDIDGELVLLPGFTGPPVLPDPPGSVYRWYPDPTEVRRRKWYYPADNPTLFHRFSSVELTKEGVIEFAEKFGELKTYYGVDVGREHEKMGDSWSDWEVELREFRLAYRLWIALKNNDEGSLQSVYSKYRENGGLPPPSRITQESAWRDIGNHISIAFDRNILGIQSKVTLKSEGAGLNLVFEPRTLIAFIWLQLAQFVTTSERWKFCDFCGKPFKPESMKARYCSRSHRQMAYHKRKETGK